MKRLLQVHEITCSSATIAAYMEEMGWECLVVAREVFEKWDCSKEFHNYRLVPGGMREYYTAIVRAILGFRPNIILLRSRYELLPVIRFFAPLTPLVLQFHGSEIRGKENLPWQARLATARISSTKDIARWGKYYGTPISPMFKPDPSVERVKGTALYIRTKFGAKDCLKEALEFAEKENLELEVIDRTKGERVPHSEMPDLMRKYEWYLDLKGITSSTVLSKTAIEFLHTASEASPAKVLTGDGRVISEFRSTTNREYFELFESLVR